MTCANMAQDLAIYQLAVHVGNAESIPMVPKFPTTTPSRDSLHASVNIKKKKKSGECHGLRANEWIKCSWLRENGTLVEVKRRLKDFLTNKHIV